MTFLILPNKARKQPGKATPLNQKHWLAKDATFAMSGVLPIYDAANDTRVAGLSLGGSGWSQQGTSEGYSLYTPNGGWADFTLNQDWFGPNTVIALCRINGVDTPWGGLFSKNSSGTSTQFAVGRFSSEDALYGSVDDSTAIKYSGTVTISALNGFNVLAFTHSGVASTAGSFYQNGALVGSTTALGTQPSGTGTLGLGRERASSATADSDVDWIAFVRIKRVLDDREIAEHYNHFWSLWEAPSDRLLFLPAAAGTVALTGQSLTTSQGILTPSTSVALSGQSLTTSQGILSPSTSVALSGQSLTTAQGTLAPSTSVALSGQSLTTAQGSLTVAGSPNVTVALSGQVANAAQGSLSPATSVAIAGQSLTTSQGTLAPNTAVALSGQALTSGQGTLSPTSTGQTITIQLTGQSLTLTQGFLGAPASYVWDTTQGRAQPGRGTFRPLPKQSEPEIVVVDIPEEEDTHERHPAVNITPIKLKPIAGLKWDFLPLPAPKKPEPQVQVDYMSLMRRAGTTVKTRKLEDYTVSKRSSPLTRIRGERKLKGN